MPVLVTGANGFVGSALCEKLEKVGIPVRRGVKLRLGASMDFNDTVVANVFSETNWSQALQNVEQVVHLAARVHVAPSNSGVQARIFQQVNVEGTSNLVRQAAIAGVKRFVFLSSVKVNGEFTELNRPFRHNDVPAPRDFYALSKFEAEAEVRRISAESGMEAVIIRPPLVYGPGVRANFESMMRLLARNIPLPLGAIKENRRSFVAMENLVDMIVISLSHPAAANQILLVSDDEDLSTVELLTRTGNLLGCPARLFSVPPVLLGLGAMLIRKQGAYNRLCQSLQLDIQRTRKLLDWSPPVSLEDGLRKACEGFCR